MSASDAIPIIHSRAMQRIMERVLRVAQTDTSVLIVGETGVGKELVAQALHDHSLRAQQPWVDVNCAAIPEHLFESELFGYERGAFSGADSTKPGLFELAHGGTLFLDEIGDLEAKVQVKLLRVLDGVPYYRLGGLRKITVDVRVMAATNRDLSEAVREGRFRSDLYHRLSQIQIEIPPLRERPEDILPIARHFLRQKNPQLTFSSDAERALQLYSWPGNVRELRNVITTLALLTETPEIHVQELLPVIRQSAGQGGRWSEYSLEGLEQQTIRHALEETNGHREKAAALLGISRRTLTRRLKQYGTTESTVCSVA